MNLTIILIAGALSGCSTVSKEDEIKFSKLPDSSSVVYANAEHRMMMISNPADHKRFCAEPPPDASISVTDSESEKASVLGKEENIGDTTSAMASSLGGRNSTVLLARDILYRVCELSSNTKASYEQSKDLFLKALKTIEVLGGASQATGPSSKIGTTSTINETLGVTKKSSSAERVPASTTTTPE